MLLRNMIMAGLFFICSSAFALGDQQAPTRNDPVTSLTFPGMPAPTVAPANCGKMYYDLAANAFKFSSNTGAFVTLGTPAGAAGGDLAGTYPNPTVATISTAAATLSNTTTPSLTAVSGSTNTGFFQVNGKTSGALKVTTADATAQTLTLSAAAQTTGAATVSIPDMAGTSRTVVTAPSGGAVSLLGPTAARVITVPDAASTMARTDAGQTFTGVEVMTSPSLLGTVSVADPTTPAISLATGKTNTGTITVLGKTSGGLVVTTTDATAQTVTFKPNAQTTGAGTLAIPDLAGTSQTVVTAPSGGAVSLAGPTAARVITVPDSASTMARTDAGQTFTGVEVMTSPSLLGTVGIADPTTPAISFASGKTNTGALTINGKTSGSVKLTTADATAQAITLTVAAQTTGAASVTLADMGGTSRTFVTGPSGGAVSLLGPTAARVITVPDAASSMGRIDAGQTFTGVSNTTSWSMTTPAVATYADVVGAAVPAVSAAGQARVYVDSTTNTPLISGNAGGFCPLTQGRNVIINGDFRVNQRPQLSGASASAYFSDRWNLVITGATPGTWTTTANAGQDLATTSPVTRTYGSSTIACATTNTVVAGSNLLIRQTIEPQNVPQSFKNGGMCVSFWVKTANITGSFGVSIQDLTNNKGALTSFAVTAGTWTYVVVPFGSLTAFGGTLELDICLVAGSTFTGTANTGFTSPNSGIYGVTGSQANLGSSNTNAFTITGIQIEDGKYPTPYEFRSYQQELAMCQRYCYAWTNGSDTSGFNVQLVGIISANNGGLVILNTPVSMRTAPTLSATAAQWSVSDGANAVLNSLALSASTQNIGGGWRIAFGQAGTTWTTGRAAQFYPSTTSAQLILSADY